MIRRLHMWRVVASVLCAAVFSAGCSNGVLANTSPEPTTTPSPTVFAIIGDYGDGSTHERDVANLVASWNPDFIVTVGDDYYPSAGGSGTGRYDRSTGAFYAKWLKNISTSGKRAPVGKAKVNAFFPTMGNHDYSDAKPAPESYLTYFTLPGLGFSGKSGNERYYDFVEGPIHFFILNSNKQEPDGTSSGSIQARWLKRGLGASDSTWNLVLEHHPPYSSRGSRVRMHWPYAQWGADAVLSGHAHFYERIMRGGFPYFVNGLGGAPLQKFRTTVRGSVVRYRKDWGAQRVTISDSELRFDFFTVGGKWIDSYSVLAKKK